MKNMKVLAGGVCRWHALTGILLLGGCLCGHGADGGAGAREHGEPMLSLRKAETRLELSAFHERASGPDKRYVKGGYLIEPKYDGVAVSLVYEEGRFIRALTRGDGVTGEEVTQQMRVVGGFPEELPAAEGMLLPERLEVRGEVYVPKATFLQALKEKDEGAAFATPRSMASGSLALKDPVALKERNLQLVVFGYGAWLPENTQPMDQKSFLRQMEAWGFRVPKYFASDGYASELSQWVEKAMRLVPRADFPADGIVVKVNDRQRQLEMGVGSRFPHWAIAIKFPGERAQAQLYRIEGKIGRTGRLTFIGHMIPIELAGREVKKVALHHAEHVRQLGLGEGDLVIIEMAGDAIPKLVKANLPWRPPGVVDFQIPNDCPSCGTPLEGEAANLRCPEVDCPARRKERLAYFIEQARIEGLGASTREALLEKDLVADIADLFTLKEKRKARRLQRLLSKEQAEAVLAGIEASWSLPLETLISALGIPGMGPATVQAWLASEPGLALLGSEDTEVATLVLPELPSAQWGALTEKEQRYWIGLLRELLVLSGRHEGIPEEGEGESG